MKNLVLLVVLAACGGCSMLLMKKAPPETYRGPAIDNCTSSVAAPVVDTIFAISYVSGGLFWLTQDGHRWQVPGAAIGAGMAILMIGSASTGYSSADRCSRLRYRAQDSDYRYGPFTGSEPTSP